MTVVEYEALFHKLDRHATSVLTIKNERVPCFVGELRLFLCMSTKSMVVMGRYLC